MKVYTLKSCDTCRKALKWADSEAIGYENQDIRADGLTRADVAAIVGAVGWETALNRRSTTWRGLDEAQRSDIDDAKAIDLIVANPTLMKRPVWMTDNGVLAGFDDTVRNALSA